MTPIHSRSDSSSLSPCLQDNRLDKPTHSERTKKVKINGDHSSEEKKDVKVSALMAAWGACHLYENTASVNPKVLG